jgi:hypothetical protein
MHYDVLTLDQALEAISKARDIETLHRAHCSSAAALARGRVRQAIAHSIFEGNPPLETKDRAATVLKGAIDDLPKAMPGICLPCRRVGNRPSQLMRARPGSSINHMLLKTGEMNACPRKREA